MGTIRDEYSVSDRFFVYGEVGYLRDKVARLSYLISPIAGAGYKVVKTDTMTFDVFGGIGGAFEKLEGHDSTSSGAFRAGEAFTWKVSPTVTLGQNGSGLWKANDTGDAFLHFDVSLATSLSKLLELKLAYLVDHKTRRPRTSTRPTPLSSRPSSRSSRRPPASPRGHVRGPGPRSFPSADAPVHGRGTLSGAKMPRSPRADVHAGGEGRPCTRPSTTLRWASSAGWRSTSSS